MGNKLPVNREEIDHRQGLDLVLMLINYGLSFSGMPENEKPDLRVLKRIMEAVKSVYPFDNQENHRATALRVLKMEVAGILQDELQGKFSQKRSQITDNSNVIRIKRKDY